jgi:hypothetical protein
MKKILLFSLMAVFSASALNAQKKNVIKIRPFTLAVGMYDFMYERSITDHTSVGLEFSTMKWNLTEVVRQNYTGKGTINSASLSGYMVTPQFRYYFKGESPKGFYLNPFLEYGKYTLAQNNTDQYNFTSGSSATVTIMGLGAGIGYQWILGPVSIDWNFLGLAVESWGLGFKYDVATMDNIDNANTLRDNLNNAAFFTGYDVKLTSGGGLEVSAPSVGILPMLKTNFSVGIAF